MPVLYYNKLLNLIQKIFILSEFIYYKINQNLFNIKDTSISKAQKEEAFDCIRYLIINENNSLPFKYSIKRLNAIILNENNSCKNENMFSFWVTFKEYFLSQNEEDSIRLLNILSNNLINQSLSHYQLLNLYTIVLRTGRFQFAYFIRNASQDELIKNFIKYKKINKDIIYKIVSIYLERKDDENSLKYFKLIKGTKNKKYNNFCYYIRLLYSSDFCLNKLIKIENFNNEVDKLYGDAIINKNIALVGPGNFESIDGELIDSHDLVIRLNYEDTLKYASPIKKGTKCNITYFSGGQTTFFLENKISNWPKDITWLVTKVNNVIALIKLKFFRFGNISTNIRSFIHQDSNLYHGSLNLLPNILLDLVRFNAKSIKVFHSDLYLTLLPSKGYYENFNNEVITAIRGFSYSHDPLTQYFITNTLWKNNKIIGDEYFENVMTLDALTYMKILEMKYSKIILESI